MLTTRSIHRAFDHSVALTASGVNLQSRAQSLCDAPANHGMRFYVHNVWCDESCWHKDGSARKRAFRRSGGTKPAKPDATGPALSG